MDKGHAKNDVSPGGGASTDPRFANFTTDPRFRLPSKRHSKTTIDKRFSRMLKDDDFIATARVDRYGRKIKSDSRRKALARLYEEEAESKEDGAAKAAAAEAHDLEVDDEETIRGELRAANQKYDPARQGGFSSSESESDSESADEDDEEEAAGDAANAPGPGQLHGEVETGEVTRRIAIVNMDWDHVSSTDLMALFTSFLPAAGTGGIEKVSVYPSEFGKERMRREELEGPPREIFRNGALTRPIAGDGEGERKEDGDEDGEAADSEDEDERIKKALLTEGDDEDFDHDALRTYQLDRLRYYYAVMVCLDEATAQKLYEVVDGTEYLSSSNFLDLRFVPDDVTFEDVPRDSCDRVPESYQPVDFVTDALQSSKVRLTWDTMPEESARKESIKRAFGGSRAEIEENDLRAYLASDSETDGDAEEEADGAIGPENKDEGDGDGAAAVEPTLLKKELARRKMREALGLGEEPVPKNPKGNPVGDMQVTFTAALTGQEHKAPETGGREETVVEKYVRKERERKESKRQKAKAKRAGLDGGDDRAAAVAVAAADPPVMEAPPPQEDLGFDDPFFTAAVETLGPTRNSKSALRKEERRKKREARDAAEADNAAQAVRLKQVMAENEDERQARAHRLDHFDMSEIMRVEKHGAKQQKKKKKKEEEDKKRGEQSAAAGGGAEEKAGGGRGGGETADGLQEGFRMDVGDKRFQAVFHDHEFAIDPSNPRFRATEGMRNLLEEGRKRRKSASAGGEEEAEEAGGGDGERARKKARRQQEGGGGLGRDLSGLVASVKRKARRVKD